MEIVFAFVVALAVFWPVAAGLAAALDGHDVVKGRILSMTGITNNHRILVSAFFQTFPVGLFAMCAAMVVAVRRFTVRVLITVVMKVAIIIASQEVSLALFVPAILEIVAALVIAVAEVRLT